MYQHQHAEPPMQKLRNVPAPVFALLQVLLAKDPNRRFQAPAQLQWALTKVRSAISTESGLTADDLRSARDQVEAALPKEKGRKNALRPLAAALGFSCLLVALSFFYVYQKSLSDRQTAEAIRTEKGVAVLPFESLSESKSDAYFADGVQDEILNDLAKIAQLKVISRTSVMRYRGTGPRDLRQIVNTLSVTTVLEGTVRRAGNRVRVSTELVDAQTDNTIWADSYERELTDVFAIQSDIAQVVASKLSARLSPSERKTIAATPTSDAEAYDLYLRAKQLVANAELFSIGDERENLLNAVTLLEEAARKDPRFVLAYCLAARAHDDLYLSFDRSANRRSLGDTAIAAATRLQPDLPDVHLATARHLYDAYRDYEKARQQIALAEHARPNRSDALTLAAMIDRRQGRWDESTKGLDKAVTLDPRNPEIITRLFDNALCLRQFRDAEDASNRLVELGTDKPGPNRKPAVWRFAEHADVAGYRSALEALPSSAKLDMGNTTDRIYFAAL